MEDRAVSRGISQITWGSLSVTDVEGRRKAACRGGIPHWFRPLGRPPREGSPPPPEGPVSVPSRCPVLGATWLCNCCQGIDSPAVDLVQWHSYRVCVYPTPMEWPLSIRFMLYPPGGFATTHVAPAGLENQREEAPPVTLCHEVHGRYLGLVRAVPKINIA